MSQQTRLTIFDRDVGEVWVRSSDTNFVTAVPLPVGFQKCIFCHALGSALTGNNCHRGVPYDLVAFDI